MLRKHLPRLGIAVATLAAVVLGAGAPAQAAPSTFTARAVHGGGAGAVGAATTGGFAWTNRSVSLTDVRLYVRSLECAYIHAVGYHGNNYVDSTTTALYCSNGPARWFDVGNIPLDGSQQDGGIILVEVEVIDTNHNIRGYAHCARADSSCTTGQW
jgi:hypothetical protein